MPSSATQNESLRHRLRERLTRLRPKSRHFLDVGSIDSTPRIQGHLILDANSQHATATPSSSSSNRAHDTTEKTTTTRDDETQTQINQSTLLTIVHTSDLQQNSCVNHSVPNVGIDVVLVSSDIWSIAYREAVDNLGKDIDAAILEGENVAQLFKRLEEIDKEATQESAFLRGVRYLHSLQVPLERFKLALDLASPLTNIEPTSAMVLGVVRSVTAIAISFATADLEFAKQIGDMLEQISYIDDCDTLGQKANKLDIHKALVLVYQKLLEFYNVAFEILTRKGAKLVLTMILENNRLPNIVQDFLKHAENLRKLVQKATWEIVQDIKAMLYDHEIARWLGSGRMGQQSNYHIDLQNLRADQACEFLLTDANFINWYQASNSHQLVILGDMGCGKSVAMAFLVDELRRRNEHQLPQPKICYHYCRDDDTGQAISIYSSLILSVLEQLSGLKRTLFEWYKQTAASGNLEPATDFKKLEEFLQKILQTIDRPLFIIIDGLDECDRASQNSLLRSLNSLSRKTPRLKVILSSRPQQEILEQLDEVAKIRLKSNAERDRFIVEMTVDRKLFHLSKEVRALVTETLSRLAQGSAIWTKMIVELIEVRRIRALSPMRDFLENIRLPEQLSELYANLFSQCTSNDSENQKLVITALEVLAIVRRPLSILELAWAVALATAQKKINTLAALADLVDHQRIMSLIQPFVAYVDFDDVKKRQVRLVHQSVKEFVITEWHSDRSGLQGPAISTPTGQGLILQRIESLEAGILNICIRYLLLDDFGHNSLFSEEQLAIEELPQEFDLFSSNEGPPDYDPCCTWEAWEENMIHYDPTDRGFGEIFVYASCYWLEHFGAIAVGPLPSLENIENLCQAGSTRLQNWVKQYCRPECTIKPRFLFDSKLYDPLSITSLYGSEVMLRDMLERSEFSENKFLPNSAIGAAGQILHWGNFSRLRMLFFGSNVGHQLRNLGFFRLVMEQWCTSDTHCQDWETVFDLIDEISDKLVKERWGNELLCMAASMGCMPIIRRLMDKAQHKPELRAELLRLSPREPRTTPCDNSVHFSIGEAVLGNHVDVVEYLLEQPGFEAQLQYRNSRGENILHLASRLCNPAMFRILVPRFKEGIHQRDEQQETVLVRIIKSSSATKDRYESAQILLSVGGANGDDHSSDEQHDPMGVAVRLGELDMCRLQVCIGKINPLSALRGDDDGQMVFKEEVSENEQNMLAVLHLLRAHADAASPSGSGHLLAGNCRCFN